MGQRPGEEGKERERENPASKIKVRHWILVGSGIVLAIVILIALITASPPQSNTHIDVYRPSMEYDRNEPVTSQQEPTPQGVGIPASGPNLLSFTNPDGKTNWITVAIAVVGGLFLLNALGFLNIRRGRMLW